MNAVLIGAGGHAQVVFEAMVASGLDPLHIVVRADKGLWFMGMPIQTPECLPDMSGLACHAAIGNNAVRKAMIGQVMAAGGSLHTVVHPRAIVSPSARIGAGSLVAAGSIVSAMASVGEGVIVNHGAVVDHDCVVSDATHIAPGVVLGGAVRIGRQVLVGSNATVLPGLVIGDDVVVGAGSVVTKDIASGQVWIGTGLAAQE
ncbi:hypothetical protein G5B39_16700 (plasmid) [Rhodobacteraceae bacterium SC52]|nr:hypothetical protein G5B39_16700 [Rhodobacteraceae bacterium SC52]